MLPVDCVKSFTVTSKPRLFPLYYSMGTMDRCNVSVGKKVENQVDNKRCLHVSSIYVEFNLLITDQKQGADKSSIIYLEETKSLLASFQFQSRVFIFPN